MNWKNGGGITHEIALAEGPRDFSWRLSIAEVSASGAFSLFQDHHRILTVIEGNGIDLVSKTSTLSARLKNPVSFSGNEKIHGQLSNGSIRDFNLIYDPEVIDADVDIIGENKTKQIFLSGYLTLAVYAVHGSAFVGDKKINPFETLIGNPNGKELSISSDGWAIAVTLRRFKKGDR